jgi:hypothetical protein
MSRDLPFLLRVGKATLLIAVIGAVGGVIGGIAVATVVLIAVGFVTGEQLSNTIWSSLPAVLSVTTGLGALYGSVLGPLYAWTMLRRAPLWRAIGETAVAATIGVGAGVGLASMLPYAVFIMPVLLSTAAAVRLRFEMRHSHERPALSRDHP